MSNGSTFKLPWNKPVEAVLWVFRITVGLLFIFSGFIKANDPLGFGYKLHDYYEVFGSGRYQALSWLDNGLLNSTATETAMLICIFEIALGVALIIGYWPKAVTLVTLLMMIFFTFLTGFSHYTGEVTECGCFGDAIPLTAKQSYIKDIILMVPVIFMFLYRSRIRFLFGTRATRGAMAIAVTAPLVFTLWASSHLPFIDFRGYKIGNDLCQLNVLPPDAKQPVYESILTYENSVTGETRDFTMDEFTSQEIGYDSTWVFVNTENKLIQEGDKTKINLSISDADAIDVTDLILQEEGPKFLLIAYDVDKTKRQKKRWKKINKLIDESEAAGAYWYGLSSSGADKVEEFRHDVQAAVDFYVADATELKTIVRSNPGIVLMDGCEVRGKWHWRDVPSWKKAEKRL